MELTKLTLARLCRLYIYEQLSNEGDYDYQRVIDKIHPIDYSLDIQGCIVQTATMYYINNCKFEYSRPYTIFNRPFEEIILTDKGKEIVEGLSIEDQIKLILYSTLVTSFRKLLQFLINKLPKESLSIYLVHDNLTVRNLATERYDKCQN